MRLGGKGDLPVTSYTFSSTMMYMPESASLCDETSATEKDLDMIVEGYALARLAKGG